MPRKLYWLVKSSPPVTVTGLPCAHAVDAPSAITAKPARTERIARIACIKSTLPAISELAAAPRAPPVRRNRVAGPEKPKPGFFSSGVGARRREPGRGHRRFLAHDGRRTADVHVGLFAVRVDVEPFDFLRLRGAQWHDEPDQLQQHEAGNAAVRHGRLNRRPLNEHLARVAGDRAVEDAVQASFGEDAGQ